MLPVTHGTNTATTVLRYGHLITTAVLLIWKNQNFYRNEILL